MSLIVTFVRQFDVIQQLFNVFAGSGIIVAHVTFNIWKAVKYSHF